MTTTHTEEATTEGRFNEAIDALRKRGVRVAINVMTCCRSCTGLEDLGIAKIDNGMPITWTFGGQNKELVWLSGAPYYRDDVNDECTCTLDEYDEDTDGNEYLLSAGEECSNCRYGRPDDPKVRPARSVHFNHEGGAGEEVRAAFEAHRFTVDWDGDPSRTVVVEL